MYNVSQRKWGTIKSFFKSIKRIVTLIIVVIIFIVGYFTKQGYDLYRSNMEELSLDLRVKNLKEQENYIKLEDISKDYLNAVIAVEDKRFYEHKGIDPYALFGATYYNIKGKRFAFGGSTISQQLAKNLCLDQSKNINRKIAEIFATIDIEKNYSKDEILEMYVNIAYFGDGFYGIGDASYGYFKKYPNELNLNESTLLAGLPNAPSIFQLSNNYDSTYQRQIIVIEAMIRNGYVDEVVGNQLIEQIKNERGM